MKILILAIACSPRGGSESAVGWRAVREVARHHDVWVLTHVAERENFEAAAADVPENVHVIFHGEPNNWHPNRLYARLQSWQFYRRWLAGVPALAADLHAKHRFDITHHVTYVTWRLPSPLSDLDIPFVWGPIGGGEVFPVRLLSLLSAPSAAFELGRIVSNFFSSSSSAVKKCARRASHIFASNHETADVLARLRGTSEGISVLSASFFSNEEMIRLAEKDLRDPAVQPLRLFAGGNLEGRKGIGLALRALKLVADQGIDFEYFIGGFGGELAHLKQLAQSLGLADKIIFSDSLNGREYVEKLQSTHVYLLPSLRDNAPRTLMEAMLAGCVPIVLKCGGPAEIVTPGTGLSYAPTSPKKVVREIADGLITLARDASKLKALGLAARERIRHNYGEAYYLRQVEERYAAVVRR